MHSMRFSNIAAAVVVVVLLAFAANQYVTRSAQCSEERAPGVADVSSSPASNLPASAPPSQWAVRTGQQLQSVVVPGRDLTALTRRLKLHTTDPVPSVVNAVSPNYATGTHQTFNVADLQTKKYHTINATIWYVTPHAYWYVKDDYGFDPEALKQSADWFESHIYPTDRRIFGSEPNPGIDNDPHITVLMTPLTGLHGYFSLSDTYPKSVNPFSNEREMIYIANLPGGAAGSRDNGFEATLAHEFQHMIHWNVHKDRDVWLDEGCSEIAMYLNGYDPGSFDSIFLQNPDTQLNAWAGSPSQSLAHYGASYLFLLYLMDHYGGEGFITDLMHEPGTGIDSIDAAVKKAGNPAGFEGAYTDWLVANIDNDRALGNGRYTYVEGGQAAVARTMRSYPATRGDTVHQYGADYIRLSGSANSATVTFKGSSTARVLPVDPHSGQGFWYSNRRDSGDSTLTRNFDLSNVSRATLQFWTWYDIESGFDYAYVEASTDGGQNWTPLRGRNSTSSNPNGQSFGTAWTGKSGAPADAVAGAKWIQESVDLTAYAGKAIQIRFEYVTDEGYNGPGFAIDDLRVPEIGYSDRAETDNGWQAQGFVRIGSTMPERWFVALVERGTTQRVQQITVNTSGVGTLDISGLGGSNLRDAVLVVSPMAPKTTEVSSYTVTVTRK